MEGAVEEERGSQFEQQLLVGSWTPPYLELGETDEDEEPY
jgi:hypothetical protein